MSEHLPDTTVADIITWSMNAGATLKALAIPLDTLDWHVNPQPVVYFVHSGQFIKIGTTTRAQDRVRTIAGRMPEACSLVLLIPGGHAKEAEMHARFHGLRANGEWFRLDARLIKYIKRTRHKQDVACTMS